MYENNSEQQNAIENLNVLLKARDVGKLTKKVITNKNGHKQTVYVRSGEEPVKGAQKKSDLDTSHAESRKPQASDQYSLSMTGSKKDNEGNDIKQWRYVNKENGDDKLHISLATYGSEKKWRIQSNNSDKPPMVVSEKHAKDVHAVIDKYLGAGDSKTKTGASLEKFSDKTSLIPSIIASSVSGDRDKDDKFSQRFEKYFEKRIVALYNSNPTWKKKLDSEKGRDYAYMLANHWMDSAEKNGIDKLEKEATMNKAANLDFASSMLLMKAASSITQAQKDLYTVVRDICTSVEGDDNRRRIYGAVEGIDDGWCLDATRPYNAIERAYLVATGGTIADEQRETLATALNVIIQENAAKQKARQEEREEKVERSVSEEVKLVKAAQPKVASPARTVAAFLPWQLGLLKADMKR